MLPDANDRGLLIWTWRKQAGNVYINYNLRELERGKEGEVKKTQIERKGDSVMKVGTTNRIEQKKDMK